jgi:ribosomal protein S18 acetylase RimI-like enzyme
MEEFDLSDPLGRAQAMLLAIAIDRSTSVVPVPGGRAVLNTGFPAAHNLNRLAVTRPCAAAELAEAAERVLGGQGLPHRLIDVTDVALAERLAPGLAAYGYQRSHTVLMAAAGPARKVAANAPVAELDLAERSAVASQEWRRDRPDWSEKMVDQLGRRIATVLDAAQAHFLAIRDPSGAVLARADLYLRDGVGQIEEVVTEPAARGRGLASRLVLTAVERARAGGAELVFLVADADDWPQQLYRRLGFTTLGASAAFTAMASASAGATAGDHGQSG